MRFIEQLVPKRIGRRPEVVDFLKSGTGEAVGSDPEAGLVGEGIKNEKRAWSDQSQNGPLLREGQSVGERFTDTVAPCDISGKRTDRGNWHGCFDAIIHRR